MSKTFLYTCCLAMASIAMNIPVHAQRNEIFSPNIASLQVMAGDDWLSMPVVEFNGENCINIGFDELSHTFHRYTYRIEHCEADWSVSEGLFESDYIEGFAEGNTIDNNEQSLNTNTLYTHYSLTIPNERCKVKMSGNYRVVVVDDNDDQAPVLTACFMVTENAMSMNMSLTSNTDIDINGSHQQVGMSLNYNSLRVTDPHRQIKTIVLQNGRWDNAVSNARWQYTRADGLVWDHCRDLIFPAGNEYRKFETLDPSHTTMGLERVSWDGKQYHAWPWTAEPRPNYVYDEDANGAFCIRNSDNIGNDTESDYIITHFRLVSPPMNGEIYVNGAWAQDRFEDKYKMEWNAAEKIYEAVIPLKQGYYNYQYLMIDNMGMPVPVPSEGNFYETENAYQALVYYRGQGERSDRLVGYATVSR